MSGGGLRERDEDGERDKMKMERRDEIGTEGEEYI